MNKLLADDITKLLETNRIHKTRLFSQVGAGKTSKTTPLKYTRFNKEEISVMHRSYGSSMKFFSSTWDRIYPSRKELLNFSIFFKLEFESFIGLIVKLYLEELVFGLLLDNHVRNNNKILQERNLAYNISLKDRVNDNLFSGIQNKSVFDKKVDDVSEALRKFDFKVLKDKVSYDAPKGLILKAKSDNVSERKKPDDVSELVLIGPDIVDKLSELTAEEEIYEQEMMLARAYPKGLFSLIGHMISIDLFGYNISSNDFINAARRKSIIIYPENSVTEINNSVTEINNDISHLSFAIRNKPSENIIKALEAFFEKIRAAVDELKELLRSLNIEVAEAELGWYDTEQFGEDLFYLRFDVRLALRGVTKSDDLIKRLIDKRPYITDTIHKTWSSRIQKNMITFVKVIRLD